MEPDLVALYDIWPGNWEGLLQPQSLHRASPANGQT